MRFHEGIFFFEGDWRRLEQVRAAVDSHLYGLCEIVADEGKKFQVNIEVVEIT